MSFGSLVFAELKKKSTYTSVPALIGFGASAFMFSECIRICELRKRLLRVHGEKISQHLEAMSDEERAEAVETLMADDKKRLHLLLTRTRLVR